MRFFKNISPDYLDIGPHTEVRIATQTTIRQLREIWKEELSEFSYSRVRFFLAVILANDKKGITIQLVLTHLQRYHLISDFLSHKDIESLKVGRDGETYVVIKQDCYDELWKRYSVSFAYIDFIGTKEIFRQSSSELIKLLERIQSTIDVYANSHPEIAIISFADSLILKTAWSYYKKLSYSPEEFLKNVLDLRNKLHYKYGIGSYVIVTQGHNLVNSGNLLHRNSKGNHIGLLSVGPPFASLFGIDSVVKDLSDTDKRSFYLDKLFYDSLNDKSFLDGSTLKNQLFVCPFLKTTNKFIAINSK